MGYDTTFKWDISEYRKLYVVTFKKVNKEMFVALAVCLLIVLLQGIRSLILGHWITAVASILLVVALCFIVQIASEVKMRKVVANLGEKLYIPLHLLFFEDRVELSAGISNKIYMYDDLVRIIETDTNFYFFADKRTAFSVWKNKCSPELTERIRRKLK